MNSDNCGVLSVVHSGVLLAHFGCHRSELQKRADRADQSVLFFMAGANFWEKHAKNRQKHAKTGAFLVLIFWGKNCSVLIFTPFATMTQRCAHLKIFRC